MKLKPNSCNLGRKCTRTLFHLHMMRRIRIWLPKTDTRLRALAALRAEEPRALAVHRTRRMRQQPERPVPHAPQAGSCRPLPCEVRREGGGAAANAPARWGGVVWATGHPSGRTHLPAAWLRPAKGVSAHGKQSNGASMPHGCSAQRPVGNARTETA